MAAMLELVLKTLV
jgi:hypothetical protein